MIELPDPDREAFLRQYDEDWERRLREKSPEVQADIERIMRETPELFQEHKQSRHELVWQQELARRSQDGS